MVSRIHYVIVTKSLLTFDHIEVFFLLLLLLLSDFTAINNRYQLEALQDHTESLWKHFNKTNLDFNNAFINETVLNQ